jgi:hypothetical protein
LLAQADLEAATLRASLAGTIPAISADSGEVVSLENVMLPRRYSRLARGEGRRRAEYLPERVGLAGEVDTTLILQDGQVVDEERCS